jgi:3-oxoacyl-[acyl-carrier-protein] synthase II
LKKRVVITGIGLITPLGTGNKKTWSNLCQGKSGITEISKFDTTNFKTKIAGEVKDFCAKDFLNTKEVKRTLPFVGFAVAAASIALEDSKLTIDSSNKHRTGVITGCGMGGLEMIETTSISIEKKGPKRVTPFYIPSLISNMASGTISIKFGATGPNLAITTACAAGSHAIGEAYQTIKRGAADIMITGGVEAVITPTFISGFNALKALSTRNNDPQKASRPFDKERDGFVVSEGSGILILETYERAVNRGARIYAEIIGYGASSDGYHMTAPSPDGDGAARCMQNALDDADINYKKIDYINAHGTSTPLNDLYETIAIKTVFKDHAYKLAISSTKSMIGHLLGGSGGVEAAFSALTISDSIIPPTINLDCKDENCDLDYVPNIARKQNVDYVMTNSFGFGGTNATLILKKM